LVEEVQPEEAAPQIETETQGIEGGREQAQI